MHISKRVLPVGVVAVVSVASVWAQPEVSQVEVKLGYPWGSQTVVSCHVAEAAGTEALPTDVVASLSVRATDRKTGVSRVAIVTSGDTGATPGDHEIVWDLASDGVSFDGSSNVVFSVACVTNAATYCVIDLSDPDADRYPVTYLAAPPKGGFADARYKTELLVLRRVEADAFTTQPFYIGLYEVTVGQYARVMGGETNGSCLPVADISYLDIVGRGDGDVGFVGRIVQKTGLALGLPTEAQWERACRAGTSTAYSYGDDADGAYMWYGENSGKKAHEVGTRLPNPWGFYDMHGNVFEWCLDAYTDPTGAQADATIERIRRGGSWFGDAVNCMSSTRGHSAWDKSAPSVGFRLALEPCRAVPLSEATSEHVRFDFTERAANPQYSVADAYVLGVDPTDPNACLKTSVAIDGDNVAICWSPDLGDARSYTLMGSHDLVNWSEESLLPVDLEKGVRGFLRARTGDERHFFKVVVDMR